MKLIQLLRESAFGKIGALVSLILTLALFCLFYFLTYSAASSENNAKLATAQLTSQSVLEKLDRNFYERFGDVQAFAINTLAVEALEQGAATPELQSFMNTMTAYYVLYDLMMICDLDGNVLATNTTDKDGKSIETQHLFQENFRDEEWFKACTASKEPEGGAWVSDFMTNPKVASIYQNNGYGMVFTAPIHSKTGSLLGVWYNFASWKEVADHIREEAEKNLQKKQPEAFIIITNLHGRVICASNKDLIEHSMLIDSLHLAQNNSFTINGKYSSDLLAGWASSYGAYTYKGKRWHAVTLTPKTYVTWNIFFSRKNITTIAVSFLSITIMALFIYRYFKKTIIERINFIRRAQEKLSQGELLTVPDELKSKDEIGEIIQTLSILADRMKEKAAFADEIASGNLRAELSNLTEKDTLGNSLINMLNQLKSSAEKDRQNTWAAQGLAEIAVLLRSSAAQQDLYATLIPFLVKYTNSNQGGIFIVSRDNNNNKILELKACYAYDKKKFLKKQFDIGDGLIGQCFLEKSTQFITQIPENYVTITSGLGEIRPRALLIVPLQSNDKIYGVLELASLRRYSAFEISVVEKFAESIASSIALLQISGQTTEMLAQLKIQTEEMQSQKEELLQNMEELAATQEEMIRKEKEYLVRIDDLESKN